MSPRERALAIALAAAVTALVLLGVTVFSSRALAWLTSPAASLRVAIPVAGLCGLLLVVLRRHRRSERDEG